MRKLLILTLSAALPAVLGLPRAALGQGLTVGTYQASFQPMARSHVTVPTHVVLRISEIGADGVKAKASVSNGWCHGEWEMQGSLTGNVMVLKSVRGTGKPDCFAMTVEADGNVINGYIDGARFQMRR